MKKIMITAMLVVCIYGYAQVGIGTTTPSAQLEIAETITDLPALKLNPQSTPTGSTTGQIAVIGDQLYMFDRARTKWLSVEGTMLSFGLENGANNRFIEFAGDISSSGPRMPYAGTIVYVSMNSSGGNSTKEVQLYKNGIAVPDDSDETIDGLMQLSSNVFTNTTYNLDFEAGDYFQVRVTNTGGSVQNLTALLWVKWRQD